MKTIGLIINPVAGMGGRAGLKGTDGSDILKKAIQMGASKEAPVKAAAALKKLLPIKDELLILTASGDMGEDQCRLLDFNYEVIHKTGPETFSDDTVKAAEEMEQRGAELIIFAGGDGTARDIFEAVGDRVAVLGIPAGVKIHSPVYGNTPKSAGELVLKFLKDGNLQIKLEEVVDIDEDAYRNDQVMTKLCGYLKVPYKRELLQNKKAPTPLSEEESQKAIALDITDKMIEGVYYIIGPGTTTAHIMDVLNLPNTLLGVDIVRDKALVRSDCGEKDMLEVIGGEGGKLVITPTGGQGYLLGRGNQQISHRVLQIIGRDNIIIIAPDTKIIGLRGYPLLIDTGDERTDKSFSGYYRIKVGYGSDIIYKVSAGY